MNLIFQTKEGKKTAMASETSSTPTTPPRMLPVNVILGRALSANPGRPFTMYHGTEYARTVQFQARGDVIEWTDDGGIEALASGLYAKCPVYRGAEMTGYRWLFLCPLDSLTDMLERDRDIVGDAAISNLAPAAAWWASCLEQRHARNIPR